jgi:hypothetical protein
MTAGRFNRSGKEDHTMVNVLVKVVRIVLGRLTVLILWP